MNRAKARKFHYIYKITRFDGMFYIGLHSTDNLEDGYFGSGQRLWKSIRYHGKDKHTKEILEFLPSRELLIEREKEIINAEFLTNVLVLNLALGGGGDTHNENTPERISAKLKEVWADLDKRDAMSEKVAEWWTPEKRFTQSELKKKQHEDSIVLANISAGTTAALARPEVKQNMSSAKAKNWLDPEYRANQIAAQNLGKQTEEFSRKQSDAKLGDKNPNFGLRWIYNPVLMQTIRVPKSEPIPNGWLKGRKMYKQKEVQLG